MSRKKGSRPARRGAVGPFLLGAGATVLFVTVLAGVLVWNNLSGPTRTVPGTNLPGVGQRPSQTLAAAGRLLIPFEAGLSVVALPDRAVTELVTPGRTGSVTSARGSPDASRAAYAYYHVRAGDQAASSEIYLTDLAGEPRPLIARDRQGTALEAPEWSPDGRSIYFGYTALEDSRVVQRVERIDLDTGSRAAVTSGALPTVSPDGRWLAHLRIGRDGDALILAHPDGREERQLIAPGRYTALGAARFSPDGRTLAVPVSGVGQAAGVPHTPGFVPFAPGVAFAHGDPWEVVLVDVETGAMRQITRLVEDEIGIAWSPDGDTVAVYGSRGLYLVDRSGEATFALDRGGYGGIDWTR